MYFLVLLYQFLIIIIYLLYHHFLLRFYFFLGLLLFSTLTFLLHQPAGRRRQGRPLKRLLDGWRRPEQARRPNSDSIMMMMTFILRPFDFSRVSSLLFSLTHSVPLQCSFPSSPSRRCLRVNYDVPQSATVYTTRPRNKEMQTLKWPAFWAVVSLWMDPPIRPVCFKCHSKQTQTHQN
jgi:hypothetical protein